MIDETEFMEVSDCDEGADIACACGSTSDLIFKEDGTVICEECKYEREAGC